MLRNSKIEKSFREGESFVDWLPYWDYDDGVFLQVDGSMGKMWELGQIPVDLNSEEKMEQIAGDIQNLFIKLPEGIACQLILFSDSQVSQYLSEYEQFTSQHSRCSEISMKAKINRLREGKDELFQYRDTHFGVKRIRVLFTLRYFPTWLKPSFADRLTYYFTRESPIRKKIESNYKTAKTEMDRYVNTAEEIFRGAGIKFSAVDSVGLLSFLWPLFNPKRALAKFNPTYHPDEPLREQMVFNSPMATGEGFDFEGVKTRIISLKELPLQTFPGMFTAEVGDKPPLADLVKDFIMVMNIYIPDQQAEISAVKRLKTFAFLHKTNLFGDTSVESRIIEEETNAVIEKQFGKGLRLLQCRTHFILTGEDEVRLDQAVDNVVNNLHYVTCEGIVERMIGKPLYLQCLPLGYDPSTERFVRRARRFVSDNVTDMLPLYGTYRGSKTPAQVYLNRRGEIVFFDFFDNDTAPHSIICGQTGAGKSFWINDMIMQTARLGANFFVLDKGGSYKKICDLNQGQYINIEPNKPICINPFVESELTPERQSFLISLLSEMASGGEEQWRLNREKVSLIQKGIVSTYNDHEGDKEITLSEVVQRIEEQGEAGKSVAMTLSNFLKDGPYGGFFDGQNEFNPQGKFIVFELGALSTSKDLQVVMLLNIMYYLSNRVSSADVRGTRQYLLIDEAWSLLNTQNTAVFLEQAFRTFRKYGCSVIAITQQTQDFKGTTAGQAILANAPNRIYLKQAPEVIAAMKSELDLSDTDIMILKTLDTVKGKFSEALIKAGNSGGVVRLISDPTSYWMFTTDPRDERYLKTKINECENNLEKAIQIAGKEHPNGIH